MGINWLDITVLVVLAVFFITGLLRGFVRQVFSILAIGGGLIVAVMFFDLLGSLLVEKQFIQNNSIANVIGFILILIFTYIIIQLLGWIITKLIGTLQLNWVDRLGGGILGGLFGIIVGVILIAGLTFFYGEDDPTFKNSVATPYLKTAYLLIKDTIPNDIDKEFQRARKLIRNKGIVAAAKVKEIVVSEQKDKKLEKKDTIKKGSINKETTKGTETKK
jgi:membrane protein required for colicin V production